MENIKKSKKMKQFKDTAEDISGSIVTVKKNCELCGKNLKHYQNSYDRPYKFVFINITQEPATHYFCSKKCKNEWIFNPSNHQIVDLKTPSFPNQ